MTETSPVQGDVGLRGVYMHEELDKKIIEAVRGGRNQFYRLSEFLAVHGRSRF